MEHDDKRVIIHAAIIKDGVTIATGLAVEVRGSSQINKTSALENCETSAIGRALAAFGLGGSEYASANEVENAIHQQHTPKPPVSDKDISDLSLAIADAADLTTIETTILRGSVYQRLKSNGPAADYDRLSKLAKAKHAVLKGSDDNADSGSDQATDPSGKD